VKKKIEPVKIRHYFIFCICYLGRTSLIKWYSSINYSLYDQDQFSQAMPMIRGGGRWAIRLIKKFIIRLLKESHLFPGLFPTLHVSLFLMILTLIPSSHCKIYLVISFPCSQKFPRRPSQMEIYSFYWTRYVWEINRLTWGLLIDKTDILAK
jgi:hypothetical protein